MKCFLYECCKNLYTSSETECFLNKSSETIFLLYRSSETKCFRLNLVKQYFIKIMRSKVIVFEIQLKMLRDIDSTKYNIQIHKKYGDLPLFNSYFFISFIVSLTFSRYHSGLNSAYFSETATRGYYPAL